MGSGVNIGIRHILPMYLFLSVLVAGAAWKLIAFDRRWAYAVGALLLFQAVSSARTSRRTWPTPTSCGGGPANTYKLLSDSNSDWGQQLKSTHHYLENRGLKECWFAYFAEGAVDPGYYGIPCKPLPTPASFWFQEEMDVPDDVPDAVDGTVLIRVAVFSGFEFGAGALNPYQSFKTLRPTAVIDYGVLVFDGHFQIPLAAALSHAHKSQMRLGKATAGGPGRSTQAVALVSDGVKPNVVLGDALTAMGQVEWARPYYRKALRLASTVEPEFQVGWVKGLRKKRATED